MIRSGQFGNVDSVENIQITMKDSEVTSDPHSFELFDTTNETREYARSTYVAKSSLYHKPIDYTASTSFSRLDYTKAGVDRDHAQVFKTAGYPQLNQVQHTAFNIADLRNLDMNAITANDLIWVANKTNNDWDVFRITFANIKTVSYTHLRAHET